MMIGIALVFGLVFLQADDDFVGVQDRYILCRKLTFYCH